MVKYPNPVNPVENIAILIFRINAALIENGNRITNSIGQSSARWHVLGQVEFQPQTVSIIARNMGRARQSVQRITDALEGEGLVEYSEHPTDNRTKLVALTDKGRRIVDIINERNALWVESVAPFMDIDKLEQINSDLEQIAEIIETNQF